ncbi:MAG: DUF3846 domain-containing protein [Clostridia bacterium]|nr:DUF3846 domain-containing protein [Clostridia bacterium]
MREIYGYLLDPIGSIYEPRKLQDDIHTYYRELHCDLIDITVIQIAGKRYQVICDDEGLLRENPLPTIYRPDGTLVGACFITGLADCEGNLTSLTDDDVANIARHLVTRPDLKKLYGIEALLFAFG